MTDDTGSLVGWIIPAVVVFGVTAIAVAVIAWAVHRARTGPGAIARAEEHRARAGIQLVQLDDTVADLDLEAELSGALYGGNAPPSIRRARLTAQHARDQLFDEYRALSEPGRRPAEVRHASDRITAKVGQVQGVVQRARADHAEWMRENVTAAEQVASARRRLDDLRATMGDPEKLVADLRARFDESEWRDAAASARAAVAAAEEAQRLLDEAAAVADDPTRSALPTLAAAERELRRARDDARTLEESHRLVLQASAAVSDEVEAATAALRQATALRDELDPDASERLGVAVREADAELGAVAADPGRRPTEAVARIARIRDRLDSALGDARTAQQRLRGARTALPGTLAAARGAVARAEASVGRAGSGADARVRLSSAQQELAAARSAPDPVAALDAARRALRHAEDAQALADYARMTR